MGEPSREEYLPEDHQRCYTHLRTINGVIPTMRHTQGVIPTMRHTQEEYPP